MTYLPSTGGGGDALTTNPLSQFAATTSLQLKGVISDETGSGALVFATSPALVTPDIGTPSAGTLTNCTGLPAAGVSGLGTLATQSGTFSGTSSGTNTGDQTSVSGNAGTATALQTARNIDGQSFDGTGNITVIAPGTHAATSKATPVDADEVPLVDSAASNVLKRLTWANLKATLKTYFDTLYPSGSGSSSGTNTGDQTITLTGNVTGSGTGSFAATIANDAVTYAKMQNVSATDKVLGRSTAGSGDVEEIACTAAGRALIDDADATAQRTTLGLGALAVKATVATADIDNDAITYAKIQNVTATDKLLGRSTAGSGDVEEITCTAAGRALIDDADAAAQRTTLSAVGVMASVNTTGLSAAVSTATLFTPTADGMFRVSVQLKITTTGTSPVAGPVTITYTDADGSVAQSHVMMLRNTSGAVVTTTVNNSTTTGTVNGDMVCYAKSGVAIQYAVAVSGTFGSGRYSVHLKCEAL